ncbi:MAG: DUF547 domain-containing protein, partial [Pseudomonadota bacterium]
ATGQVNYPGIQADARFNQYLDYLANTNPDTFTNTDEKLSFWINAYNALTIKGILDGLSPGGFFSRITFFKSTKYQVAGMEINLYDLERDIIIPFSEPRIHFAINCASASCPVLIAEAYTAGKLEQQLEANTIAFLNDATKNKFDLNNKTASVSKIFDWFPEDFKQPAGSVQKYLAKYVDNTEVAALLAKDGFRLNYMKYDWSLNGTAIN